MSTKSIPKEPTETKVADSSENINSPIHQTLMSGGLEGWLGNITARNRSGESVNPILPREKYPPSISVESVLGEVEGRGPRLHRRNTSRGSQIVREKSLRKGIRNSTRIAQSKTREASLNPKRFRLSAFIPFILSAAAFSFSLVLILAGSKTAYMTGVNFISFNTTNLGTGIIEFAPATSTTTAVSTTSTSTSLRRRGDTSEQTTISTAISTMITSRVEKREPFDPLDPLGLIPALSSYIVSRASVDSSILASGGNAIATALPLPSISLPGLPIPTGSTSSNGSTTTTGALGDLGSFITNALSSILSSIASGLGASGITQAIDDSLNNAVFELISKLISSAGVEEYYSLYTLATCQGSSSSNISSCSSFSSAANSISDISTKIPSSLVVVGTNVSSPALGELITAISTLGPLVESLEKLFLALMILSLINSASAIVLSFLGIVLPENRKILYANMSLASLAILSRSIDAILATTISVTLGFVINKFGKSIGVSATVGSIFITLVWLGLLCQLLASIYWIYVWFVEFRQFSFRIRKREASEIGDYRGIIQEIKSDLRFPKEPKEPEKNLVSV